MFKLKKIELLGFKSFADRTLLQFGEGTAAVVGPNGCGKSNLSDAISWVLGEQSARMLRGDRMADVIFNGTSTRPPTGMAEVRLTLIDPEYVDASNERSRYAPAEQVSAVGGQGSGEAEGHPEDDSVLSEASVESSTSAAYAGSDAANILRHRAGEITVARRLFRSGESEYLLNGESCRLRDIQDLFMGTGLGPESYAIIEQGRIGQILSSKPCDRRAIIEEAAGVSKFKSRKRLAEAKLESARANLSRITDILEEVTKQVGSLKRQASKARRYQELREELRERQKVVLTSRLVALEAECGRLGEELAAVQGWCSEAAHQLETAEREQKAVSVQHEQLEGEATRLRESLAQGELEYERLRSRLEQMRQQAASLETRAAEAGRERQQIQSQISELEREASDRGRRGDEVLQEWNQAHKAVLQLSTTQVDLSSRLAEGENQIEACRRTLLQVVSQAAELRNQLVQAEEIGLSLDRQLARAETERAGVQKEHERASSELEVSRAEYLRGSSALENLVQSASQTASALDQAREEDARRREGVETLRHEFVQASARKQALEESLARHSYATESVRRLLSGSLSSSGPRNGHSFRPLGVLADFVEVSPGYEEVVEEFLKHELDCVVVEHHEEARQGIALLQAEGTGRSTFFVTRFPSNGQHNDQPAEVPPKNRPEGVIASLQELVRFEARLGLNGDLALPALVSAYLVEDAAAAERLAQADPTSHFLTPKGEHYHHRLVSGGKVASAGPLALRRDFRDLERRTAELESQLGAANASLAEVAARVARLAEELRTLNVAKLEADKQAVLANERVRQADEAGCRAAERLEVLQSEVATLTVEHQSVLARRADLQALLEATIAEHARHEQEAAQVTQRAREARVELDKVAQDLTRAQARSSALEERTLAIEAERTRLVAQLEGGWARLAQLAERVDHWREEQNHLNREGEIIGIKLAELEAAQTLGREQLSCRQRESSEARNRRDGLSPQVEAARAQLDARRQERSEVEVAQARAESDLAHHAQQCREELNAEPAALTAEVAAESVVQGEPLLAAEDELRELKKRIENLGPVNMMALEELLEAEERFGFLETQRQDLLASIEDTAQTIREIDQVSRRQFLEAFKAINAYFAESFRTLFGGGIGEMRFSDETDPESGIDIAAQPPGKRLQNVLLLSGGEKALTALALLIAVFRFTPSPFCVLDEVDAPLDDSNVERFTRMIRQMSRHTQFILITHNKRTMEICPVLYGVTMQEPGVSKLISVRFEAREPELEAVAV